MYVQITGNWPTGFTVPAGDEYEIVGHVTSSGSVIVYGALKMRPGAWLEFTNVNEANFVGGAFSDAVAATDIGIWVRPSGRIHAVGTPKTAYKDNGQPSSTWFTTDDMVVTPTGVTGDVAFPTYVWNQTVPQNPQGEYSLILNLTRDVKISGTSSGKSHVHIAGTTWNHQILSVELEYMGVSGVLGRYPIHFHAIGAGPAGTQVYNCVVKRSNHHAFVVHATDGVKVNECISYDVKGDAYWYDAHPEPGPNNLWYLDNVAAWSRASADQGGNVAGFWLGKGTGNICEDCRTFNIRGDGTDTSGFHWPSANRGVWDFKGHNRSRNNKDHGIFVWQNATGGHFVPTSGQFTAYNCGKAGIEHGAYGNRYQYGVNSTITIKNVESGLTLHALAINTADLRPDGYNLTFENIAIDGAVHAYDLPAHFTPPVLPVLIRNCTSTNISGAKVWVHENVPGDPGKFDFVSCGLSPSDVQIDSANNGFVLRIQEGASAWSIDYQGTVTSIPLFYV